MCNVSFPHCKYVTLCAGTAVDIRGLADSYDAKFVIASKVEVNGGNAHPLFEYAKAALPGICGTTSVKWNFTKFLFDSAGTPVSRYSPTQNPFSFEADIRELVAKAKSSPVDTSSPKNNMQ